MSRGIGVLALALLACGSTVVLEPGPLPGEPLDAGVVVADGGPSMPPPTDAGSATPADGGGGAGGFASDSGGGNVGGCGGGLVLARTFGGSAPDRVHPMHPPDLLFEVAKVDHDPCVSPRLSQPL